MPSESVVERTQAIASQFLAPRAALADQATGPPAEQIRHLAEAGLLGLTTTPEYGGLGAPRNVVRDCLAAIASGCGLTAFVSFQHLVGCRHLAGSANGPLKQRVLPELAAGRRFCSLAFSHLRCPGPPILQVRADGDEWVFDGTAPWMTGWGLADEVLLAGVLPDGRSAWVLTPLVEGDTLRASPPAPTLRHERLGNGRPGVPSPAGAAGPPCQDDDAGRGWRRTRPGRTCSSRRCRSARPERPSSYVRR